MFFVSVNVLGLVIMKNKNGPTEVCALPWMMLAERSGHYKEHPSFFFLLSFFYFFLLSYFSHGALSNVHTVWETDLPVWSQLCYLPETITPNLFSFYTLNFTFNCKYHFHFNLPQRLHLQLLCKGYDLSTVTWYDTICMEKVSTIQLK